MLVAFNNIVLPSGTMLDKTLYFSLHWLLSTYRFCEPFTVDSNNFVNSTVHVNFRECFLCLQKFV